MPCERSRQRVQARLDQLIKPKGSLGDLETLLTELGALTASDTLDWRTSSYILFGADHGVTVHGVSPYPQAVTEMMLDQMAEGRAASSIIAQRSGMQMQIIDVGVATGRQIEGVITDKTRNGTADFLAGPAMSDADLVGALAAGCRAVARADAIETDLIVFGEMGIGNTTTAAAVLSALVGLDAAEVVGAGTGHSASGIVRKADVVRRAIAFHELSTLSPPTDVLQKVGGLEIAALAGGMISAGQRRIPVLLDGFIATVAARAAIAINPTVKSFLIPATKSPEPGHAHAISIFERKPILDLGLRLGEGTGAALALHTVQVACELYQTMRTFEDADIPGPIGK